MLSPAQQHKMRVLAAQGAAKAASGQWGSHAETQVSLLMARKLDADRRRLHDIQSNERKAEVKREILPDYAAYIDGVIAGGAGAPDEIVGYVLAWRIDVGDYEGAFAVASYVLKHGMDMPDRFRRTPGCYLAEEIAEAALRAQRAGTPFEAGYLFAALGLTESSDMPDQVRAKLYLALGRQIRAEQPAAALKALQRALELYKDVGAKKDIEQLERQLRNAGKPGATEPPSNDGT